MFTSIRNTAEPNKKSIEKIDFKSAGELNWKKKNIKIFEQNNEPINCYWYI